MSADRRVAIGQGWAGIGLALLALALVIAGLVVAGGPMQARKERRDEARMHDLNLLAEHIACLSRQGDAFTMPTEFAATEECPGPIRLADRQSDAAYRVEPLSDGRYRLCAAFELPTDQTHWLGNRRTGDCVVHDLPRAVPVLPATPPDDPAPLPRG